MNNHTQRHHGEHHTGHGFHRRHEDENARPEESERHHGRGGQGGHRGGGPGHGHFGGSGFGGPRGGEEGRERGEGRGGRARRGEARYILLDALRDSPKHGYEIIKLLEERSGGRYSPSPGTVYPTMQLLEDLGFVRADKDAERRVFSLTEAGLTDLDAHAQEIADFWVRFAAESFPRHPEAGFVREELESLMRTIRDGLSADGNQETARGIRSALERCRSEIREMLANSPQL